MTGLREIALDTETTGLDPAGGHRIVEIGCVEMINRIRTGKSFHAYINPERDMPEGAFRVHGLSAQFLSDKPLFAQIVEGFIEFIGDSPLVIHNASFDMRFLNAELSKHGKPELPMKQAIDTLVIARQKFPGSQATLDALCRRFNIDLSQRTKHGALLDAELLADVYLELTGGSQVTLSLDAVVVEEKQEQIVVVERSYKEPRPYAPTEAELAAHELLVKKLKNPLWETV